VKFIVEYWWMYVYRMRALIWAQWWNLDEWEGFQSFSRILHFTVLPVEKSPRSRIKIQLSVFQWYSQEKWQMRSCLDGVTPRRAQSLLPAARL
jgi:hypothetical protein